MRQLAELLRVAAKSNVRKFSTSQITEPTGSSSVPPKSMIQVPVWGLVGLGAAAAGFFGKVLHDDNLETRRELQNTTKELREGHDKLRDKMDDGFKEINKDMKEIKEAVFALRPGQK